MGVIVTDTGFQSDDWTHGYIAPEGVPANQDSAALAVDLASDASAEALRPHLADIDLIRVAFPAVSDGRGFTLARQLRRMGFEGRLRAAGHLIADQYAMARRAGFDEVEITEDKARRQPAEQWQFRADWRAHDYQNRLRA